MNNIGALDIWVNAGAPVAFEADGQNNLTVNAGTYNVVEPGVAGYTTTYQGCANIVLPSGGSATCTITNTDVPRGQGSIAVSKSADPTTLKEPGGPVTFSVTITNTSVDVIVTIDNVVKRVEIGKARSRRFERRLNAPWLYKNLEEGKG